MGNTVTPLLCYLKRTTSLLGWSALALTSLPSLACESDHCAYGSASLGVSADAELNEPYGRLAMGYRFADTVELGVGYHRWLGESRNDSGLEGVLRLLAPITPQSRLFVETGPYQAKGHYYLGAGLRYQGWRSWSLDLGYRRYQGGEASGVRYTGGLTVNYALGLTSSTEPVQTTVTEPRPSQPLVTTPVSPVTPTTPTQEVATPIQPRSSSQCLTVYTQDDVLPDVDLDTYVVKKDDWLLKIARQQCVTFEWLVRHNTETLDHSNYDLIYPEQRLWVPKRKETQGDDHHND